MLISLFTLQLNELPLRQHLLPHPHTLLTVICVVVASVSTTTNGCSNFSHCVPVPVVASRLHTITGWRHDGRVRSVQVPGPGSRWQVGGFSGPRLLAAAGSSGAVLYSVHPHTAHSQYWYQALQSSVSHLFYFCLYFIPLLHASPCLYKMECIFIVG